MQQPLECPSCHRRSLVTVKLPENAAQMRTAIIGYLGDNPMGIGGGTLTQSQIVSLLDATLPE